MMKISKKRIEANRKKRTKKKLARIAYDKREIGATSSVLEVNL